MEVDIQNEQKHKQLITKRGQIKSSLTRFATFIDKCKNNIDENNIMQLEKRLEDIYSLLEKFDNIQNEIELISPIESTSNERQSFEDQYYEHLQVAKKMIQTFYNNINEVNSHNSSANSQISNQNYDSPINSPNVRFPTIDLPKFYGDYEKWGQFRDMFTSLVHNHTGLDNIKKFYYLLSCVKGDAAKVIECIEVTNDNYQTAWDLLVSRFQNKSIIIKHHIGSLFELPSVGKDVHIGLRNLTDAVKKHIRSLENLGEPVQHWDTLLFYLITKKFDSNTQREWETFFITNTSNNVSLTFKDLIEFLEKRCLLLETIYHEKSENKYRAHDNKISYKNQSSKKPTEKTFSGHTFNVTPTCPYCKENHYIFSCENLKSLPVASRLEQINKLSLCTNCLRDNHLLAQCRAQGCKKCKQFHNTLLHPEDSGTNSGAPKTSSSALQIQQNTNNENNNRSLNRVNTEQNHAFTSTTPDLMHLNEKQNPRVLLSTAIVLIKDSGGGWHQCRALLDSGSQPNFITTKLSRILHICPININVPVMGVGNSTLKINKKINTYIKSSHSDFSVSLSFLILDNITASLPSNTFDNNLLKIPNHITLADREFNISREIDMVLGAGIFYDLMCSDQIKLGAGLPILQQTHLGWVISGCLPSNLGNSSESVICNLSVNKTMENAIEKFWKLEEIPEIKIRSVEEQECENLYIETTKRDDTGHFIVNLPIRDDIGKLGHSLDNAIKRLHSMERKFAKNPIFKNQYVDFMNEYESLGHMTQIDPSELNNINSDIFYLPHHGVINQSSLTTKLRVVFDGSCKSSSGISLNDLLKVGPTIQNDLVTTLLRFRQHNVVITSDIAKMYRQVNITKSQRDLQRIVWRSNDTKEVKHYRLNTVTYGTSCAAFLAIRSLQQVAIENRDKLPEISDIIINDFYVDDLLTGVESVEQAIQVKQKLSCLLNEYGFELRKWVSNRVEVLERNNFKSDDHYIIVEDETKKTLGLLWRACSDILTYRVNVCQATSNVVTKRVILSSISKLFDPLGLLSPIIVLAKIMMQSLWQLKVGWDDRLPDSIAKSWSKFTDNLQVLNNLELPRQVIVPNANLIQLHGFCDASQKAYAACIYIKSVDQENNTCKVELLCSKTKIAPLKTITLPRIELCGALLLSQLYDKVQSSLNININHVFLWSDSTITLSWIASSASTLKIFVGNRVSEIQRLTTKAQWRHVPTEFNPADIASRGVDPHILINNRVWWNGPQWLFQDEQFWPKPIDVIETDLEKRKSQITLTTTINEFFLFSKFSTLYKLQRVTALCLRFINNIRKKQTSSTSRLSPEELDRSLLILVKIAQSESFQSDINCLKNSKSLPCNSRLKNLDPFIDPNGLLRVGGRLSKSNLPYDAKHQLILSPHHILTRLIILNEHHRNLHIGSQSVLYSTRQRFWILNGRSTIRNVINKCITCFRVNPKTLERKMADLPADRVTPHRPFYIVGIDYAGPFYIKDGKLRNRTIIKAYLCLFVCFTSKAVHLELVSDLSTDSFLNALKRFVARRGLCKRIYSDNGSNFVGADKEIKELYCTINKFVSDREIIDWYLKNNIEWRFNPPYSPHRGGLWEAAVRQAKYHLKRVVGRQTLTFENLYTILAQIEAIMNSRPLHPLSNDPHDLSVLTPGHFLIGQSLSTLPQTDLTTVPENRLKQYQILQQAVQLFWKKWSNDYLNNLQQRSRWQTSSNETIQQGSMVLLIEENCPPLYWKLGRIIELHRSSDGVLRTVTVRTQSGITVRAVQKLCLLPICDE